METTSKKFDGSNVIIDVVEEKMSKFTGGEIFISQKYWSEGIAVIFINNPEKKNAITGKMMIDFKKCVEQLENWHDGKAIILTGVGDNFCSGGDLDFARKCGTPEEGFCMSYLMQEIMKRFKKLDLLSVALIHGPTLGGGAEITVACDYVIASDNVKFGFVQAKMGIVTAWGGATGLVNMIGKRKALDLLLSSKILNAEECLEVGLATKIVKTNNKMDETLEWIRRRTTHHFNIVRSFKRICTNAASSSYEDSLTFERELFCPTWGSEENRKILRNKINHIKSTEKEDK